jgi:membrane-associated protease RseP (regulator of RpoE activity)
MPQSKLSTSALLVGVIVFWCGSGQGARAQTFLEQLEAKVRSSLELAAAKAAPGPEQPAPTARAAEELPAPSGAGASGTSASGTSASGTSAGGTSASGAQPRAGATPAAGAGRPPAPSPPTPGLILSDPDQPAQIVVPPEPSRSTVPGAGVTAPAASGTQGAAPLSILEITPDTAPRVPGVTSPAGASRAAGATGGRGAVLPSEPAGFAPQGAVYLGLEAEPLVGGGIGVRVVQVTENSPAWRGGFRVGDVIQALDGYAIAGLDTMVERLALRRAGEPIRALVLRNGRNVELTAVLQDARLGARLHGFQADGTAAWGGPAPAAGSLLSDGSLVDDPLQSRMSGQLDGEPPAYLGVSLSDLTQAFRLQFGIAAFRGAAVTNVIKGSPADLAGIRPGDAIVDINGLAVEVAADVVGWMTTTRPGDVAQLVVLRGQVPRRIEVVMGIDPKQFPQRAGSSAASPRSTAAGADVWARRPTNSVSPAGQFADGMNAANAAGRDAELREEVEQLRDELHAAREQIELLQRRVQQLQNQKAAEQPEL